MKKDFIRQPKLCFDDSDFLKYEETLNEKGQRSNSHNQRFSQESQTSEKNSDFQKLKKNEE
ncbi:MAG: hypothetical protein ACI4GY_00245 [Acutalibacteraceae bacterium]